MDNEMVDFLCLRGKIYHFRRRVPEDLKSYFPPGYNEISRTLGTSVKSVAKVANNQWTVKTDNIFSFLRSSVNDAMKKEFLTAELPLAETPVSTKDNIKVSDLIRQYIEHKAPTVKIKSLSDYENAFNLYIECCGDTYLRSMDYKDVEKFRDMLGQLPPSRTTSKKYKNLTLKEILALSPAEKEILDPRSINKILTFFSSLIKFGVRRELVRVNFAEGVRVKEIDVDLAETDKDEYTSEDIQFIINSLRWDIENPSHMFASLLLIFTGSRCNEICQLYVSDIKVYDGIPCVDINGNGDTINYVAKSGKYAGKELVLPEKDCKRPASWRLIPIHPTLWYELGLSGYVETCKKSGQKRLFPDLNFHRDGYGHYFSEWFNNEISYKIAPAKSGKSLHSLRHSFQNWFKQNPLADIERGFANEVVTEITGHAYNSNKQVLSKERYGKKYPPLTTAQLVYQLDYGIDYSNITEQVEIQVFKEIGDKAFVNSSRRPDFEYPTEDLTEQ